MTKRAQTIGASLLILLALVCHALSEGRAVQVELEPRLPGHKLGREETSSTLKPFEFQLTIHDPNVDFNHLDLFANAENSDRSVPRKQNIFAHVTRKGTGQPVQFILGESGGGVGEVFFELTVPFSDQERSARFATAVQSLKNSPNSKNHITAQGASAIQKLLELEGVRESEPGDYIVQVDYISPAGKFSSKPLSFTIRDNGNLYEKLLGTMASYPSH